MQNSALMGMAAAQQSTQDLLGCDVTLFLSFVGLSTKDVMSKSDPFAVVEMFQPAKNKWETVGKTEYIKNTETGAWATTFDLRFIFEEQQKMLIRVYDFDHTSSHDFLGQAGFTLGNVMGSAGQTLKVNLDKPNRPPKSRGALVVHAEKKDGALTGANLRLKLHGHKFDSKDWFGMRPSDPYYIFEREVPGGSSVLTFKSEYIKDNNSPKWKEVLIPLGKLCRGDPNLNLSLRVFDYDDGTKDDLIGEAKVSVNQLVQAAGQSTRIPVVHPPTKKKYAKASYKDSGHVEVVKAIIEKAPTDVMLDYISGGLQLNLIVGVDFTASNGNPNDPRSLHFRAQGMYNQYQAAIASVGNILQAYDSDGMIPSYGFGGAVQGGVSHCFALNGNPSNAEVQGVRGVMGAYEQALQFVSLSGPTFFAPLLAQANSMAYAPEMSQVAQKYTILLILTDGEVMDMDATIDQIVRGSELPLSIIIVGVGSADFSKMEFLDADDHRLRSSSGTFAERDIVQFVPFNKFNGNGDLLAKEVLREVPQQIVQFFRQRKIAPNSPLQAPSNLQPINSTAYDAYAMAEPVKMPTAQEMGTPSKASAQPPYAVPL